MDEGVKICPECGAEYFAYVSECASCEMPLKYPGDDISKRPLSGPGEEIACVEEGGYDTVMELARELKRIGMDGKVLNVGGPGASGCSGGSFGLFVPRSMARRAAAAIDDLREKLYPGMRLAEERLNAGLCPACGYELKGPAAECPDCGLNLGSGPEGNGDCGGCGPSRCP